MNDILALVQELHDRPDYLQSELNFPESIALDLSKLTMIGHSFGGMTALKVCAVEPRIKACLTMDPWFIDEDFDNVQRLASMPLQQLDTEDISEMIGNGKPDAIYEKRKAEFFSLVDQNEKIERIIMLG